MTINLAIQYLQRGSKVWAFHRYTISLTALFLSHEVAFKGYLEKQIIFVYSNSICTTQRVHYIKRRNRWGGGGFLHMIECFTFLPFFA